MVKIILNKKEMESMRRRGYNNEAIRDFKSKKGWEITMEVYGNNDSICFR